MLSTFSAINATLYGSARLSYIIAKEGELPAELERQIWGCPLEGLLVTSALALVLVNLADLSSISTLGSGGFLIIFAAVNAANLAKARETGSRPFLAVMGLVGCLAAFGAMSWQALQADLSRAWLLAGLFAVPLLLEIAYRLLGVKGPRKKDSRQ